VHSRFGIDHSDWEGFGRRQIELFAFAVGLG